MSEENVEIVRRSFEIWKSRDLSDVSHLTHPDFVLDLSRNIFNPDLFRGTDDIRTSSNAWIDVGMSWRSMRRRSSTATTDSS